MSNQERGQEALESLSKALKSRERAEKRKPLTVVAIAAIAILAIVGGIWFVATRDGGEEDQAAEKSSEVTSEAAATPLAMKRETPLADQVSCTYEKDPEGQATAGIPNGSDVSTKGTVKVDLDTSQGPIGMELDRQTAPCTTNAIEHLVNSGFYDNTVCHRLTTDGIFVLQCGDPKGDGTGGPGFRFANEYPTDETDDEGASERVVYPRGTIAMANTGRPVTNGSQFFLNYKDSELGAQYTYFGKVSEEGLKTLDKIAAKGVKSGSSSDGTPAEEVRITSAKVRG